MAKKSLSDFDKINQMVPEMITGAIKSKGSLINIIHDLQATLQAVRDSKLSNGQPTAGFESVSEEFRGAIEELHSVSQGLFNSLEHIEEAVKQVLVGVDKNLYPATTSNKSSARIKVEQPVALRDMSQAIKALNQRLTKKGGKTYLY